MIIKRNCEICGKEFKTQSSRLNHGRGRFCSRNCVNIYRKSQLGDKNPCWRGGKTKRHGYWFIYMPSHPYAKNRRYVQEHRLVMEKKLGRYLKPNETVHHINHVKTDNRISNLILMSKSDHHRLHSGGKNNPMYGIVRDRGLSRFPVKIPIEIVRKYTKNGFLDIPFGILQEYLGNDRKIPWRGKLYS